jgi:RNA polymerase primary sigma factor
MDGLSQNLAAHRFAELFRDELGWDRSSGTLAVTVGERRLEFEAVAQKRGFQVLQCTADRRVLFNRGLLRRAQGRVSRTIHEHILIYSCSNPPKQVWQWAVRTPDGRRLRQREHPFFSGSPPDSLLDRLSGLRFSLDEEADVTLVDALHRVRTALDVPADLNLFVRRPAYAERSDELAVAMAQGDGEAFHAFILLHRPLARHFSKRIQRIFGLDPDDAEQIGVIGLIEAALRFDPERGYQFSTSAFHWVRQACQRFGPEAAMLIRMPAYLAQSLCRIRRHLERLRTEFGPGRANDELVRLCWDDPGFWRRWLAFQRAVNVRSLSDCREPEYFEARTLPAAAEDAPLQSILRAERVESIRAAMAVLSERQRRLVRLRYGMDGEPRVLGEIGQIEHISPERVRQILIVAERRVRRFIECKWKDLVPASEASEPGSRTVTAEEDPSDMPDIEPCGAASTSIGPLGIPVLTQEDRQLLRLDFESSLEAAKHIADALCREIRLDKKAVVDLECIAK